ncbi:unnamed protein product [Cunninghamella echinulata]
MQPMLNKIYDTTNSLKRLAQDITDLKDALKKLSVAINELTGYNHIENVKQKVQDQAQTFELTREQVQKAKVNYEIAIATRSNTQRSINELLQRKHTWTGDDVTQFTELYRLEHEHAKEEEYAKDHYQRSEKQMDQEYMALARAIMERYHDEQLWSDKIRSISTYGTWALMGLNIMLFIAVQTIFEPRKRNKLTDKFEQLLIEKMEEEEEKVQLMTQEMHDTDQTLIEQQQTLLDLVTKLSESMNINIQQSPYIDNINNNNNDNNSNNNNNNNNNQHEDHMITTSMVTAATEQLQQQQQEEEGLLLLNNDYSDDNNNNVLMMTSDVNTNIVPNNDDLNDNDTNSKPLNFSSPLFTSSNQQVYSQRSLMIYSIESALAGSLITALAFLWWK